VGDEDTNPPPRVSLRVSHSSGARHEPKHPCPRRRPGCTGQPSGHPLTGPDHLSSVARPPLPAWQMNVGLPVGGPQALSAAAAEVSGELCAFLDYDERSGEDRSAAASRGSFPDRPGRIFLAPRSSPRQEECLLPAVLFLRSLSVDSLAQAIIPIAEVPTLRRC
jgi:hypothetical protein